MCHFFFNDTATTEIYPLSLHDALPICRLPGGRQAAGGPAGWQPAFLRRPADSRSEAHTSELHSRLHLVCRLLLEQKEVRILLPKTAPRAPPRQGASDPAGP